MDRSPFPANMFVAMDHLASDIVDSFPYQEADILFFMYFGWCTWVSCISLLLIIIGIIFECCLCFNVAYVRGQRARERKRDLCRFRLFVVMAVLIYAPSAGFCFYRYHQLKNYELPEPAISSYLDHADRRTWEKIQLWFDCCGTYSYTFWFHHQSTNSPKVVPDSCCKDKSYNPGCGNFTKIDQIYSNGCLPNVTAYVTSQIRHHTVNYQIFALLYGMAMLFLYIIILHLSRKEYYGDFICCKTQENFLDRNDHQVAVVDNNIEENVNHNPVIENNIAFVNMDIEDNVIVHDAPNPLEENLIQ